MKAPGITEALLGGVLGFLVFFMMYNGGALFTYVLGKLRGEAINEVAFGYGDVMMATVSGLILGWQVFIIAIVVIVFLGAAGAAIYLISRSVLGQRYSAFTALPYGPYIVAGTIIMLLYRVPVTDFILTR
jgi:leader peptidase (prepilin peptidase)/N-methyltransferase